MMFSGTITPYPSHTASRSMRSSFVDMKLGHIWEENVDSCGGNPDENVQLFSILHHRVYHVVLLLVSV